jgi:hypothetical protein
MAYSRNPGLKQYFGFTITLDQTVVQVSKVGVGQAYLRSFCEENSITEDMKLYRASSLDLFDREGRKEFARLIIGMFRFFLGNEQSMIIDEEFR